MTKLKISTIEDDKPVKLTCPSSNGLGQSEVFWNEGSGSFVVGV
jgi:hypothetical protein